MKKILPSFLLLFSLSFLCNIYVEEKLSLTFSQMKKEDIKDLEHHSNRNFYTYG